MFTLFKSVLFAIYTSFIRFFTDRESNQDYIYKDKLIPKGTAWAVCIWALHHDPKVYPDPEKFDPERFLSIK